MDQTDSTSPSAKVWCCTDCLGRLSINKQAEHLAGRVHLSTHDCCNVQMRWHCLPGRIMLGLRRMPSSITLYSFSSRKTWLYILSDQNAVSCRLTKECESQNLDHDTLRCPFRHVCARQSSIAAVTDRESQSRLMTQMSSLPKDCENTPHTERHGIFPHILRTCRLIQSLHRGLPLVRFATFDANAQVHQGAEACLIPVYDNMCRERPTTPRLHLTPVPKV